MLTPVVRDGRLLVGEQRVVMLPALQIHPQLRLLRLVDTLVEIVELHLNTWLLYIDIIDIVDNI